MGDSALWDYGELHERNELPEMNQWYPSFEDDPACGSGPAEPTDGEPRLREWRMPLSPIAATAPTVATGGAKTIRHAIVEPSGLDPPPIEDRNIRL